MQFRKTFHVVAGILMGIMGAESVSAAVTGEIRTLRMAPDVAAALERRIDEHGAAAEAAMTKLPDLIKAKKVVELDVWKLDSGAELEGKPLKHVVTEGKEFTLEVGGVQPNGISMEVEAIAMGECVQVRTALQANQASKEGRDLVQSSRVNGMANVRRDEWSVLSQWLHEGMITMQVGRFSAPAEPKNEVANRPAVRSGALDFTIYELPRELPCDANSRWTGAPPAVLNGAKVLERLQAQEAGSHYFLQRGRMYLTKDKGRGGREVTLAGDITFGPDHKTIDLSLVVNGAGFGRDNETASDLFADWITLESGKITVVPLLVQGKKDTRYVLAVRGVIDRIAPGSWTADAIPLHPAAQRLLAKASGAEVPLPPADKSKQKPLPPIEKSLAALGFKAPDTVIFQVDPSAGVIVLLNAEEEKKQLQAVLAKHLPPVTIPADELQKP